MRINSTIPYFNPDVYQFAASRVQSSASSASPASSALSTASEKISYYAPGVVVEISQQARDAYNQSKLNPSEGVQDTLSAKGIEGCQTCKSRKYVDQSSDSSVSYQTPTHISPEQAAGKVMAHEREHVTNEQAKAQRDDRRIVHQSISLSTAICSECGKVYVSGGVARTVTAGKEEPQMENNISAGENNAEL